MDKADRKFAIEIAQAWAQLCNDHPDTPAGALKGQVVKETLTASSSVGDVQNWISKRFTDAWKKCKGEQAVVLFSTFIAMMEYKLGK